MLKIHRVWRPLKASTGHNTIAENRIPVSDNQHNCATAHEQVTANVAGHKAGFCHGHKAMLSFITSIIST